MADRSSWSGEINIVEGSRGDVGDEYRFIAPADDNRDRADGRARVAVIDNSPARSTR